MKCTLAILMALTALSINFSAQAKDMDLTTPEGVQIILHNDVTGENGNTWEYKKGPSLEPPKDPSTIELYDGRIILLNPDYSWGFIDRKTMNDMIKITIDSVAAKGSGKNIDVAIATKTAYDKCYSTLTAKIKAGVNKKMGATKLLDCIKRVEKVEDKKENFVKGVGWNVDVSMSLDRGSINAVIMCALDTTETAAATPAKAPAKTPAAAPAAK